MRGRLVLILLFATTGCTRDNPAFDGSTGTAETSGDGDPTTLDSADSLEAGGSEEGSTECTLHGGVPLEIDLGPAGCADTPESYDRVHPLVSIDGSTLWVGTCPQGALDCTQCEVDVPTPLTFTPLELGTIAMPGDCLHVIAQRANPT